VLRRSLNTLLPHDERDVTVPIALYAANFQVSNIFPGTKLTCPAPIIKLACYVLWLAGGGSKYCQLFVGWFEVKILTDLISQGAEALYERFYGVVPSWRWPVVF